MKMVFKRVGKVSLWAAASLVVIFLVTVVAFSIIDTPEYVFRVLRWGNSDVYDYLIFPEQRIDKAAVEFHFEEQLKIGEVISSALVPSPDNQNAKR